MADKIYTPVPPRASYFQEDPRAKLSSEEDGMYKEVLAHFTKEGYSLPNVDSEGALTEKEKFWLSRECLLRYLRASSWKVATAIQRLESTLKWRRDYGLYDKLTAETLEVEAVTGKAILFGYDVEGRPAWYMIPSRQNTEDVAQQNQFAVWMLERCIDSMEAGVETIALLINFAQRAKHPALGQAKTFLDVLQNHYPERLGVALILNIPFLVNAFFKLVSPFIDPVTRNKLKFNPKAVEDGLMDKDMVMKEWWGGDRDFEHVHEKYWPEMVKNCENNVAKWTTKWKALGGTIGISEWAYKGGQHEQEVRELAALVDKAIVIPHNDEEPAVVPASATGPPQLPPLDKKEDATDAKKIDATAVASHGTSVVATTGPGAAAGTGGDSAAGGGAAGGDGGGGE
ncbi:CRAL/TRIO domain-containing protein [Coprinopsis sp. MPI-PUGE-AT-0042]|nr:CRAL/TRIO domain-containing protein [Coprinopsis sp. MPI-PUGE-AT-0042]